MFAGRQVRVPSSDIVHTHSVRLDSTLPPKCLTKCLMTGWQFKELKILRVQRFYRPILFAFLISLIPWNVSRFQQFCYFRNHLVFSELSHCSEPWARRTIPRPVRSAANSEPLSRRVLAVKGILFIDMIRSLQLIILCVNGF